jgi:hypothetical protein
MLQFLKRILLPVGSHAHVPLKTLSFGFPVGLSRNIPVWNQLVYDFGSQFIFCRSLTGQVGCTISAEGRYQEEFARLGVGGTPRRPLGRI